MLSGKHFRFNRSVTGIHLVNGTASVVAIPPGSTIEVLPGPDANGKIPAKGIAYAIWEARTVAIFAVDVDARGTEIVCDHQNHNRSARA